MAVRTKTFESKKICPRCQLKVPSSCEECPDCGLVFSRLAIATNKDAKALKRRGEKKFIVNTTTLPNDVNFVKLLCLAIFTGFVGGHCFYVGRYGRATLLLLNFIMIVCLTIFNTPLILYSETLVAVLCTIAGFVLFVWFWDIFMIGLKKFKVPVGIDLSSDQLNKENLQKEEEK